MRKERIKEMEELRRKDRGEERIEKGTIKKTEEVRKER